MNSLWYNRPNTQLSFSRRAFLSQSAGGLGIASLTQLMGPGKDGKAATLDTPLANPAELPGARHVTPKAKSIIYLFQSGGPSHVDLFDYKPALRKFHSEELPDSVRGNQRVTGMTAKQSSFPVVAPFWKMQRCGARGTWMSELLPFTQQIVDEITIIKSVHTEAINHDPAITYINTGSQQMGHASLGAWLSYGLGNMNENLPAYLVMLSQGTGKRPGQPLFSRLWGNGYLPSNHQGVQLRPGASPVLYLQNPPGVTGQSRRELLDGWNSMNRLEAVQTGNPQIDARIAAYEMAFRMQTSVPELTDLSDEPQHILDMYGPEVRRPGTFAANCLLARRMVERGVRMVQLFHRGWDQHWAIAEQLPRQCRDVDQASAALVKDLRQRGLLDDTLVVWGGEFGRTVYSQGQLGNPQAGRDHHGRCFTVWLAGGGIKQGFEYGQTDDFCYNIVEQPVHIRDLNATLLHCLGIDHELLTFKFQGLDQKLTGVEEAHVVNEIVA
jgi:Protein of unknown function (DUF1501)